MKEMRIFRDVKVITPCLKTENLVCLPETSFFIQKKKKKKQRDKHLINLGHLNNFLPRLWCEIEYEIVCEYRLRKIFSTYYVPGSVLIPLGSITKQLNIYHAFNCLCWYSTLGITKLSFMYFNVYSQAWESTDIFWKYKNILSYKYKLQ